MSETTQGRGRCDANSPFVFSGLLVRKSCRYVEGSVLRRANGTKIMSGPRRSFDARRLWRTVALTLSLGFFSLSGRAQQAEDFFQQNCISCHTIGGGRLTGPDLKDVSKRKDRAWLERFIQNPQAVLNTGDPYAVQLHQEARGVVMPTVSGLTPQMATWLLDLVEEESQLPKSRFAGITISDRPFTPADIALGIEIFQGTRKLSGNGPSCISCHTLGTLQGFGGGKLGPDLTLVYERLGGRKAVGAWLSAPATPTMGAVFRQSRLQPEEILSLLSVFEDASKRSPYASAGSGAQLNFFLAGFAGVCLALAVMGWVWRGRFRNVRRSLVSGTRGAE
jgi:mono/diheme cytochrome c family protein